MDTILQRRSVRSHVAWQRKDTTMYYVSLNQIYIIRYYLVWGSLHLINREAVYEKHELFQTRLYKYNLLKNFKYSLGLFQN